MSAYYRADLKGKILRFLNKTGKNQGFYTDEKMDDAIEDAVLRLESDQMLDNEGFRTQFKWMDTVDSQTSVNIPPDVVLIKQVRYRVGDTLLPLRYDDEFGQQEVAADSAIQQYPSRYRIMDNAIYWSPAVSIGGERYLQIEFMGFTKKLESDTEVLSADFNRAFGQFCMFRSCSYLAASHGKFVKSWKDFENDWYSKCRELIAKRNRQVQFVRDFDGTGRSQA